MTKTATQPKLDGLEQKFKLLALLPYDERAKRKHSLVFGFVLDWYHSKYGDALASVRHVVTTIKERDPAGKGMSLPHVHSALSDLVAWGYLEQTLGTGKRASRYVPNWSRLKSSVTPVGNATDNDPSVTPGVNSDVTPGVNATAFAVTPVGNEDLSTPTRAQDPGTGIDRIECATPTAPLAAGLGATAARTAQGDGFDRLWKAYAHRQRKADARAAFDKLAPDQELLNQMVLSAEAWFAAWSAQSNPAAPRFTLAKWIERQEYDCDPPTAYKAKERKPRTVATEKVSAERPKSTAIHMAGKISPFSPFGTFEARIVSSTVVEEYPGEQLATLKINWSGPRGDTWPEDTWHEFLVHSVNSAPANERGRKMIDSIATAVGLDCIEDTEDLHHRPFLCTIHEDLTITYASLPVNDNEQYGYSATTSS